MSAVGVPGFDEDLVVDDEIGLEIDGLPLLLSYIWARVGPFWPFGVVGVLGFLVNSGILNMDRFVALDASEIDAPQQENVIQFEDTRTHTDTKNSQRD